MDRDRFKHYYAAEKDVLDKKRVKSVLRKSLSMNREIRSDTGEYDIILVIEELAELQKALTKYMRGFKDKLIVLEEIADVGLGIMKLQEICGITTNDIYKAMNVKTNRMQRVLSEGRPYR